MLARHSPLKFPEGIQRADFSSGGRGSLGLFKDVDSLFGTCSFNL
jgi:hypothetical protein